MRRELAPDLEYFRGVEVQARGALHDHALVWSPVRLDQRVLRRMAIRAGFGHEVLLVSVVPGSKQYAYYVSKYVTKATDVRSQVPWWGDVIDVETGEVTEGVVDGRYRTWSMSRQWGDTMASVKDAARAWVLEQQRLSDESLMSELLAAFGGELILPTESPPAPS